MHEQRRMDQDRTLGSRQNAQDRSGHLRLIPNEVGKKECIETVCQYVSHNIFGMIWDAGGEKECIHLEKECGILVQIQAVE